MSDRILLEHQYVELGPVGYFDTEGKPVPIPTDDEGGLIPVTFTCTDPDLLTLEPSSDGQRCKVISTGKLGRGQVNMLATLTSGKAVYGSQGFHVTIDGAAYIDAPIH